MTTFVYITVRNMRVLGEELRQICGTVRLEQGTKESDVSMGITY